VLHVVPHLDRVGGYERQALVLARHQRRGTDVAPILLTHEAPGRPALEQGTAGTIHRLARGLLRHHPGAWWRRHRGEIDLVHAHAMHKLTGQVLALAHADGVPSLVKVATEDDVRMFADPAGWQDLLDGDEGAARGVRWQLMLRTAFARLRRAGTFVALNAAIERQLAAHGLPSVRVPNGVDVQAFRPADAARRAAAREALGLAPDAPCVASVGRLATRKDLPTLLEAFARVAAGARGPAPVLRVAGEGPARPLLEERVAALGLSGLVAFLGPLDDVRELLDAADLFVHPSLREGLPNAVLEALACGLPAVLSDVPGHRAVTDGAAGAPALLVPPGDADALARGLAALLADAPRRAALGAAGLAHVERHFGIARVALAYLGQYRSLLGKAGQQPDAAAAGI
jgi:glycosyltransferase involved in cell wall biosynthesis